jgi:hypothetical protein
MIIRAACQLFTRFSKCNENFNKLCGFGRGGGGSLFFLSVFSQTCIRSHSWEKEKLVFCDTGDLLKEVQFI